MATTPLARVCFKLGLSTFSLGIAVSEIQENEESKWPIPPLRASQAVEK